MYLQYFQAWLKALRREEGQDLAEYALLIALIAAAVVGTIGLLSGSLNGVFSAVKTVLDEALASNPG